MCDYIQGTALRPESRLEIEVNQWYTTEWSVVSHKSYTLRLQATILKRGVFWYNGRDDIYK